MARKKKTKEITLWLKVKKNRTKKVGKNNPTWVVRKYDKQVGDFNDYQWKTGLWIIKRRRYEWEEFSHRF